MKVILDEYVRAGMLRRQKHPDLDLWIYNYTVDCQFTKQWCPVTLQARGLIVDGTGKIVARPIKKFFNVEEYDSLDSPYIIKPENGKAFLVQEKLDGSLITITRYQGQVIVASRGSFTSPQSDKARELLHNRYGTHWVLEGVTYCFELLYPENRIVLNYGDDEALVILTAIDTDSGVEHTNIKDAFNYDDWEIFRQPKAYEVARHKPEVLTDLRKRDTQNEEGYVLLYQDGTRAKLKFETYVHLHRLITGMNEHRVWELMSESAHAIDDLLRNIPEEFQQWVRNVALDLQTQYNNIEEDAKRYLAFVRDHEMERRYAAHLLDEKGFKYKPVFFTMLDNKPYEHVIWRMIEPKKGKRLWGGEEKPDAPSAE